MAENPFNRKTPELGPLLDEGYTPMLRNLGASYQSRLVLDLLNARGAQAGPVRGVHQQPQAGQFRRGLRPHGPRTGDRPGRSPTARAACSSTSGPALPRGRCGFNQAPRSRRPGGARLPDRSHRGARSLAERGDAHEGRSAHRRPARPGFRYDAADGSHRGIARRAAGRSVAAGIAAQRRPAAGGNADVPAGAAPSPCARAASTNSKSATPAR